MRKVLKNINQVCHVWASQSQSEGRTTTLSFSGSTLISCGHYTIARIYGQAEFALFNCYGYSNTTKKQLSLAHSAASHIPYACVPNVEPSNNQEHKDNLAYLFERIEKNAEKFNSARWFDYRLEILTLLAGVNRYCSYFKRRGLLSKGQRKLSSMAADKQSELWKALKMDVEKFEQRQRRANEAFKQRVVQRAANRLANRLEGQQLAALSFANKLAEWRDGATWSFPWDALTYLRIKGDGVETSKGIMIKKAECRVIWWAICNGDELPGRIATHYQTDPNTWNGEVFRVGCHTIELSEMQLIADHFNWEEKPKPLASPVA